MPVLDCINLPIIVAPPAGPGQNPQFAPFAQSMAANGPGVLVEVGFDPAMFGAQPAPPVLTGAVVPPPGQSASPSQSVQRVVALIDTGASTSCIDEDIANQLNLPLINQVSIGGVHGSQVLCQYLCRLMIPQINFARAGAFIGAKLRQGGQPFGALIGRDFLASMIFVYDGLSGTAKIAV